MNWIDIKPLPLIKIHKNLTAEKFNYYYEKSTTIDWNGDELFVPLWLVIYIGSIAISIHGRMK